MTQRVGADRWIELLLLSAAAVMAYFNLGYTRMQAVAAQQQAEAATNDLNRVKEGLVGDLQKIVDRVGKIEGAQREAERKLALERAKEEAGKQGPAFLAQNQNSWSVLERKLGAPSPPFSLQTDTELQKALDALRNSNSATANPFAKNEFNQSLDRVIKSMQPTKPPSFSLESFEKSLGKPQPAPKNWFETALDVLKTYPLLAVLIIAALGNAVSKGR